MNSKKLLIWLPSPLGDAIMATPALRSFRALFPNAWITFLAGDFTRQVLSPSVFCNAWLDGPGSVRQTAAMLATGGFDTAILLKNSFGSALAVRLAKIPRRIGYAREMRSLLLTERIAPLRDANGRFQPAPMTDYYLKIAETLGAANPDRQTALAVDPASRVTMQQKMPRLETGSGPLVILVPGGAFGPSKRWPVERFAELADRLWQACQATVVISVAPVPAEIQIASTICNAARSNPLHIGNSQLTGGELKALFERADLVIANDTGPRHIALALDKPTLSLFGPNNPAWTQTGHDKEVMLIGRGDCVPCDKPVCRQPQHRCMESITVDAVFQAAADILEPTG